MTYVIIILIVIFILVVLRLNNLDKFRLNLKPGDIGKVFLVSNEDDDLWFYVVVTKRISLTSVEVEYNVEYNKTMNNFVNGGFYFPKVLRIKEISPVKKSEHNYFCEDFKKKMNSFNKTE